jgi:hypothetical protein
LQQCRDAVARLGEKIARDVQRLGLDEMKWWNRMKAAARKKGVAEAMMKVERAKTQLTIVVQLLVRQVFACINPLLQGKIPLSKAVAKVSISKAMSKTLITRASKPI